MIYDLKITREWFDALATMEKERDSESMIEIKIKRRTRTTQQNKAIHKYCEIIAAHYSEKGLTKSKKNPLTGESVEMPINSTMIKEDFWKPIQFSMFGFDSTTELNTKQVGEIAQVIEKYFADKGISLMFPDRTWNMEE